MEIIIRLLFVLLFAIMSLCTIFAESHAFIDPEITPKWSFFYICGGIIVCLCALVKCVKRPARVFTEDNMKFLFGVIAIMCLSQAIYGLGQHWAFFDSNMHGFITGSFDNPAGFASCLVIGLPSFLYFFSSRKMIKRLAYLGVGIIVLAVILSDSRTGIITLFCLAIISFVYLRKLLTKKDKIGILGIILMAVVLLVSLYYMKKESADGRVLIWECSWEMIKDKPLTGHGFGAFNAKYMLYQADYFAEHSNSRYEQLADNVKHPFNEFLLVAVEYGVIGLLVVLCFIALVWHTYQKKKDHISFIALLSLIAIGVFSCFSYLFLYPFTWMMLVLCSCILLKNDMPVVSIVLRRALCLLMLFICVLSGRYVVKSIILEKEWCEIANKSLQGKTQEMLPRYEALKDEIGYNSLFLYNYAAELNHIKHYGESLDILKDCMKGYNDYDIQMLLADNFEKMNQLEQAEKSYQLASRMCPCRFLPLYRLVKIYQQQCRSTEARKLALKITDKKVKVSSAMIYNIKRDMNVFLKNK